MARALRFLLLLSLLLGCRERDRPPAAPGFDAGPRRDAGPPLDTGPAPPRRDAGPVGPRIDGELDDPEWDRARSAQQSLATDHPGSRLRRILAYVDDDRLYLGIEATLAEGDSLVGYVDGAVGQPGGIADFSTLADTDQPLDRALSREFDVDDAFRPELAFGTTAMPRTLMGLDGDIGWRALGTGARFTWLDGSEAPWVCSEDACEGYVPLDRVPAEAPRTLGVFARIVGEDGLRNQTLPSDDPTDPNVVRAWLEVDEGEVPTDAGVDGGLDAGVDAGADGIVIDGVRRPGEWDDTATTSSTAAALGGFAGNQLRQLWVHRDANFVYLAVEGVLTPGNAVLVYVDRDYRGFAGLPSPTPLDDFAGGLDRALSKSLFTGVDVRLDMAWGTLGFGVSGTLDDTFGWRDISSNAVAFAPIEAPTACSADFCETRIRREDLGLNAADSLAVFARLGSATNVALSSLSLPEDDPGAAELVSRVLVVPPVP